MKPLISIIIPTYNRIDFISETLETVLNQTYSSWECIIVDDGSTDNSITVIQRYLDLDSRFLYFERSNHKKKGPSSCRNFGIEKSNGEYIIFLDSDDLLERACLEHRLAFAKQNHEYDFWIFKMQTFGYHQVPVYNYGVGFYEDENEYCRKQFAEGNHPFVITCPLWKKSVLLDINGFNENLVLFEDPELHLRSLKKGYRLKLANFEQADCFYRLKENNNSIDVKKSIENSYVFLENHLQSNDVSSIIYFKKVLNYTIFKNVLVNEYFKFYKLGIQREVFLKRNVFYGVILLIYHKIGLFKLKGFGYNYFKTQFNNF